jgi:hypothetical protein
MGRRTAQYPLALCQMEDRVLLSQVATKSRGLSVVVSGLEPRQQVLNRAQQPIIAEVNQAFDSFTADYDQARATYFASIQGTPSAAVAMQSTTAFTLYTKERVALLSQQMISSFLQSPQSNARAHGQKSTLKLLIDTKIIGPGNTMPDGSLVQELVKSIPVPSTSLATSSLYTLTQDDAIQAARITMINGVNILRNADFGNQTQGFHPHH